MSLKFIDLVMVATGYIVGWAWSDAVVQILLEALGNTVTPLATPPTTADRFGPRLTETDPVMRLDQDVEMSYVLGCIWSDPGPDRI